ncbi:baseplate tail-tube junction protein [Aeromonas veronii]|nr:baseplate tail-tube junction protein [Aeromonas veronii]
MATTFMENVKNITANFMPKDIQSTDNGIPVMTYPMSMKNMDGTWKTAPCLAFTFFKTGKFTPSALQRSAETMSKLNFKTEGLLFMRMPDNGITDNLQFDIAGADDGFLEEVLRAGISGYNSGGPKGAVKGGIQAGINEFDLNLSKKGGAYATNLGSNTTISSNKGVHGFNGVQPRSWTFIWRITPRNVAELKEYGDIEKFLYKAANIGVKGTIQNYTEMQVPMMVRVEERILGSKEDVIRHTNRLVSGWCHISNLRVSSVGENGHATFAGTAGDALTRDLEITLKEITLPTAQLYENANKDGNWKHLDINGSDIFGDN